MADPVKLSSKTALSPLLPFDRLAVVRRAIDEADASKRIFPAPLPDVARAIGPVLPGPNFIPGAPKFARFKTQAQVTAAGSFGGNALDSIPGLLWCLLCPGTVEFDTDGQRNVTYIPVYDGVARPAEAPGFIVYRTGEFAAGDTIPAKLVRLASPEAGVVAYAERPATYAWAVGELTRAYVAGTVPELFFKRKTPGGAAPAPSNAAGDANWEVVAREAVPTSSLPIRRAGGRDSFVVGPTSNSIAGTVLESAIIGGGGNQLLGNSHDSAIISAASGIIDTVTANTTDDGPNINAGYIVGGAAIVGTLFARVFGAFSTVIGGLYGETYAYASGILAGMRTVLPRGASFSVILGGRNFTAPVLPDTAFMPQAYLFVAGAGVSLLSPDGLTRRVLTIDNAGALIVTTPGTPPAATPTATNSTFTAA